MARVTYLLGAGASAGSYPVVLEMAAGILEVSRRIGYIIEHIKEKASFENDILEGYEKVKENMDSLYLGCLKHSSIDIFAKNLFITSKQYDDGTYRITKSTIILFFELHRYFNPDSDKRYDAFIAALLHETTLKMPDDVNIISWNYDYEMERAYKEYDTELGMLDHAKNKLNITYKNSVYGQGLDGKFGMVKLNGTIGYHSNEKHQYLGYKVHNLSYNNDLGHEPMNLWPIICTYIKYTYKTKIKPSLSFAWEEDNGKRKVKDEISCALKNTEILVVIGYSFPVFNRDIDRHIMLSLKKLMERGGRVYVQDKYPESLIEEIVELNPKIPKAQFIPKKNVTQFYIPFDLK